KTMVTSLPGRLGLPVSRHLATVSKVTEPEVERATTRCQCTTESSVQGRRWRWRAVF
ncbi:hypothetical protein BaRGS_00021388, partial [Batillaria attramentaria]